MLKGSFKFSVDKKGRLSIPAKLRKDVRPEAENTFVFTKGTEKCIYVYPLDEWKKFEEKLAALNPHNKEEGFIRRRFLQFASDDTLDAQNRLLVPKELAEYAGLDGEAFILGSLEKFEIWNPETYDNYVMNQEMPFDEVAQKVLG